MALSRERNRYRNGHGKTQHWTPTEKSATIGKGIAIGIERGMLCLLCRFEQERKSVRARGNMRRELAQSELKSEPRPRIQRTTTRWLATNRNQKISGKLPR